MLYRIVLLSLVNCKWSSWSDCTSSCSFGNHSRTRARLKQHNGMDCVGSPTENCDSNQPPCEGSLMLCTGCVMKGKVLCSLLVLGLVIEFLFNSPS